MRCSALKIRVLLETEQLRVELARRNGIRPSDHRGEHRVEEERRKP
jgi:hypothetical protein